MLDPRPVRPAHQGNPSADGPAAAAEGWSVPTRITLVRLGSVPVLWVVALSGDSYWLGVGVLLASFTDVLDGAIARRWGLVTRMGSRLDSIADHLLTLSLVLWLALLRPGFVTAHLAVLAGWGALAAGAILVGWLRFRRIGDLHLYSAKIAGTLAYAFAVWLLLFGSYHPVAFHAVAAIGYVAAAETLLAFATRTTVDERMGSLLHLPRRRSTSHCPVSSHGTIQLPPTGPAPP